MLFSIITVCFNDLDGLKQTYNSIKNQQCQDFEWIVIDGGSKDGTDDWLKNLSFSSLKFVSEPDKGIFDAMNKGQDKATGEYIIFMNSFDEFASPNVLSDVKEIVEKSDNTRFIYGDSIDQDKNNKQHYKKARDVSKRNRGMFTTHQAMFFKLNKDYKFDYMSYKNTADYAYICEYLDDVKVNEIAYYEKPICIFKLGGTNEVKRFDALFEDYRIRRNICNLSRVRSSMLLMLHFGHTLLKRVSPGVTFFMRYKG